ncbi:unnamed protein product [Prunus armeniaca]|uniref:Uncharacterized protein n=1 Tax=Prunus armeniaca TaxID=36596 RepID=A0A6J5X6D2_PRUAR|nr:unnamed protein product [Prunus armeniaca]
MESVVVLAVMSVVVCLLCILASCLTANKEQTVTPPSGQGADHSNVGLATTVILISAGAGWGGAVGVEEEEVVVGVEAEGAVDQGYIG